jgi:hypothetical protein
MFTCAMLRRDLIRGKATQRTAKECQLYSNIPVIGLFSGAGGLDIGAAWAGAQVLLSVDNDPIACETSAETRRAILGKSCKQM